jgi:hypothetical protein
LISITSISASTASTSRGSVKPLSDTCGTCTNPQGVRSPRWSIAWRAL